LDLSSVEHLATLQEKQSKRVRSVTSRDKVHDTERVGFAAKHVYGLCITNNKLAWKFEPKQFCNKMSFEVHQYTLHKKDPYVDKTRQATESSGLFQLKVWNDIDKRLGRVV